MAASGSKDVKFFRGGMSLAFFLIVPSAIIVSIILVHALANRLGLRIYYATLIAVAVLSFMSIFSAATIAPVVGKSFIVVLGAMVFVSSILVTMANRFLVNKQISEERRFTEEVKAAYAAEIQKDSQPEEPAAPLDKFEWGEPGDFRMIGRYNEFVEDEPVAGNAQDGDDVVNDKPTADDVVNDKPTADDVVNDKPTADDEVNDKPTADDADVNDKPTADDDDVNDKIFAEHVENFPLDEVFKPLPEVKPIEADKPVELAVKHTLADNFPLDEVFKPLPEIKPIEADKPVKRFEKVKRAEFFPLQEVFEPLSLLNLDKLNLPAQDSSELEENLDTLDEILDKAYSERELGHIWQAVDLYNIALDRYRTDDYAPFIVIDLGNIFKEEALYSRAIKVYETALNLPAIKRNAEVKKEFVTNLEYLRVVRDILLKYGKMSTPYSKLTREILQEIDTEFQKVQVHSAQSK